MNQPHPPQAGERVPDSDHQVLEVPHEGRALRKMPDQRSALHGSPVVGSSTWHSLTTVHAYASLPVV